MATLSPGDYAEKSFKLGLAFSPTSPINREDLFAGRQSQIRDVIDAVNQRGQHAVLYGERGVGKTSLANMIFPKMRSPSSDIIAPQINCMAHDSYSDIWKRVFEEISFNASNGSEGGVEKGAKRILKEYTGSFSDEVSPDIVRRLLYTLGQDSIVIIIIDEFDKVFAQETRAVMSNTLKFLSDRAVPATVILIGVADDVETLIADHRSLERNLMQILMPRMSDEELEKIVRQGLSKVDMTIDPPAIDQICHLARGLPHYAHLLGLHAGRAALDNTTLRVTGAHIQSAMREAVNKAQASIQADYSKGIASAKKQSIYKHVLLACALAEADELGWFYPRDVRGPLEKILNRTYKIESFARHLHAFCEEERGPILVKDRSARPRYRFENPLMQPYVLIRGIGQKLISMSDLKIKKLERKPTQGDLF